MFFSGFKPSFFLSPHKHNFSRYNLHVEQTATKVMSILKTRMLCSSVLAAVSRQLHFLDFRP